MTMMMDGGLVVVHFGFGLGSRVLSVLEFSRVAFLFLSGFVFHLPVVHTAVIVQSTSERVLLCSRRRVYRCYIASAIVFMCSGRACMLLVMLMLTEKMSRQP